MDDKIAVVGEGQDEHFEELAVAARTDHEHLGRVSVWVHVDDDQRVLDGVDYISRRDAVSAR